MSYSPSVAGAVEIQDLFLRFPNLSKKAPCKFWIWVSPPPLKNVPIQEEEKVP